MPEDNKKLTAVKVSDFLSALSRGLKTSVLYPSESSIPSKLQQMCWEKLEIALGVSELIDLEITRQHLLLEGDTVYSRAPHELDFPMIFYKENIRKLIFSKGVTCEEFGRFFRAILTFYANRDNSERIVNLLWEANLNFIECETTDDFIAAEDEISLRSFSGGGRDLVYGEIILAEQSSTQQTLSAEESNPELIIESSSPDRDQSCETSVESMLQNIQHFSEEELRRVTTLTERDREMDIEHSAVDLLFDIAVGQREHTDFVQACVTLDNMFDQLLVAEKLPLLVYVVRKFREITESLESRRRVERMRESFHRCGDHIRISRFTQILNRSTNEALESIEMYLRELDWSAIAQLLWMLGELKHYQARRIVCDLLADKGREKPEIIAGAIYDSRWYVVRNAALILGEIGTDKSVNPLKKACEHDDERVRWEAATALCKIGSDTADETIIQSLDDESDRIRILAARHLAERKYKPAYETLQAIIEDKTFGSVTASEQREFLRALAVTGGEEALEYLKKLVTKWNPFGGQTVTRLKEMAVHAIALQESEEAYDLLSGWASKSKGNLPIWAKSAMREHRKNRDSEVVYQ